MANYARFASVYDQDAHRAVAEEFHATLLATLGLRARVSRAMDLGCGSGLLTMRLAAHAREVLGLDLSEAMLKIARERCRRLGARVSFRKADLTKPLRVTGYELATASGEVVNHILSPKQLRRVLVNVHAALAPGGVFAFDSPTKSCYELDWNDREYGLHSPQGDLMMECTFDAKKRLASARMTSYTRQKNGLYKKSSTLLRERYYPDQDLRAMLRGAGFRKIQRVLWSPWPEQLGQQPMDRSMWLASA